MNQLKAVVALLSVMSVLVGVFALWVQSEWRFEAAPVGGLQPGLIAGGLISRDGVQVINRSGEEIASMPTPCRYPKVFDDRLFCLNNKSSLYEVLDLRNTRQISISDAYHHDFHVDLDRSEVIIPSRETSTDKVRGVQYELPVISDSLKFLDLNGVEKWSWRLLDHVEDLEKIYKNDFPFAELKEIIQYRGWLNKNIVDWSHMNGVTVMSRAETDDPRFRDGQIVVSLGALGSILVVDRESKKIVRATALGKFSLLHRPIDMGGGRIAFLHNGHEEMRSEVVIYDLVEDRTVSRIYPESDDDFFVRSGGTLQMLSNGNFLVGMEQFGKVFELDFDGRILWSYQNARVHELPADVRTIFLNRTTQYIPNDRLRYFSSKVATNGPVFLEKGVAEKFIR